MNLFYFWLLPNVSYIIECICFKEISVIFLILSFFYITLVNILLTLSKYRSIFPLYRIKTNFVSYRFNRRSSCFCYYEFSYKFF